MKQAAVFTHVHWTMVSWTLYSLLAVNSISTIKTGGHVGYTGTGGHVGYTGTCVSLTFIYQNVSENCKWWTMCMYCVCITLLYTV